MCVHTGPSLVLMFTDPSLRVLSEGTPALCAAVIHTCAGLCATSGIGVGCVDPDVQCGQSRGSACVH